MKRRARYKRVLVKLSGESLCAEGGFGIEPSRLSAVADELAGLVEMGVETGVVVGGGNFLRGRDLAGEGCVRKTTADYMGMLATVLNGLALRDTLESRGVGAKVYSAMPIPGVCEAFDSREARETLERGGLAIFVAGTGCPFFTTDTCAALRASEIGADVLLKATKVDGVFDSDPVKNPAARKYERVSYQKVLADRLGVMDLAAISLCMENRIPVVVLQLFKENSLARAVRGERVGTLVTG